MTTQTRPETVHCKECGEEQKLSWVEEMNERLRSRSLCFNCNFWTGYVERKDQPNVVRIERDDGIHHYVITPDRDGGMRGFGGARFKIKFHDGRVVETRNLWCQGTVPDRFKDRLTPNAEFAN